jgi:UDP-N-acetylmuramate dehydrogenase
MTMQLASPFSGLEDAVAENVPLAPHTWYKIGGPARWFVRPRTVDELAVAARRCAENDIPIYVLGLGANLLVGDGGVEGAVFRLDTDAFKQVAFNRNAVHVGAGVDMQKVMDAAGERFERFKDDLVFDYRSTNISATFITAATLELDEDDPERILRRTKEIWMFKKNSQPLNTKNAGCVFKNPRGLSAGALIDQAGLKGLRVGGAEVSHKHANFIISHPGCRAADVLELTRTIQAKVFDKFQVQLETEVKIWP